MEKYPPKEFEQHLQDTVFQLKSEFESLKNYETKLVFPSVLKVFNTKNDSGYKPAVNIAELKKLTNKKEAAIYDYVSIIKSELSILHIAKSNPIHQLVYVFETAFLEEKNMWNSMLNNWSIGCACFVLAQQKIESSSSIS
ncbi:MAG: hypothetical protein IT256_09465 [Chitinophagaceae bacterium]|nr:hypothetical protein [Chitinophagaceae bacterium]